MLWSSRLVATATAGTTTTTAVSTAAAAEAAASTSMPATTVLPGFGFSDRQGSTFDLLAAEGLNRSRQALTREVSSFAKAAGSTGLIMW